MALIYFSLHSTCHCPSNPLVPKDFVLLDIFSSFIEGLPHVFLSLTLNPTSLPLSHIPLCLKLFINKKNARLKK